MFLFLRGVGLISTEVVWPGRPVWFLPVGTLTLGVTV